MSEACGHRPCLCAVPDEADYCSNTCRTSAAAQDEVCRCGHEACTSEAVDLGADDVEP